VDADVEREISGHLDAADHDGAVAAIIGGYGPVILGYLTTILRSEDDAGEVFEEFAERVLGGIGSFRRESAVLTWCFRIAYNEALRFRGDPYRRRRDALDSAVAEIAGRVRSATAPYLRTAVKDRVAALRESLDPDEQTLLSLRIDQDLPWNDVAEVMGVDAAALRKRFERVKTKLRELARKEGLLGGDDEA
jgi:RNA polymerase sigma-70 factor, ECF subfamily